MSKCEDLFQGQKRPILCIRRGTPLYIISLTCLQASTSEAQLETGRTAALFYNTLVFCWNIQHPYQTISITITMIIIILL